MTTHSKSRTLFAVYLMGFLIAFHTALPTYINSSFLNVFLSENLVGVVYVLGSIFTIISFFFTPSILRRFGNYKTALFLIILEICSLVGLAFLNSSPWLLLLFMLNLVTIPLVYFLTDIFLESASTNGKTGIVRGVYLTAVNLAWAASPLISGLILTDGDYWKIYLASAVFLLPVILILLTDLRRHKDSEYQTTRVWQTTKIIWRNVNLRNIFLANFLLLFFYSWMTIYTPLYLHKDLGFSWGEIGVIFSIMLLPFVFIQLPLGRLADTRWGEKEILSWGFVIMAIATGTLSFVGPGQMFLLAGVLFITRIGAAAVEIMCDTYFFKKVDSQDTNVISFFRMCGLSAYVIGPLFATVIINLFSFEIKYLFLVLSLIMFIGLKFSLGIKDTKPTLQ
jgi:MFS family permease